MNGLALLAGTLNDFFAAFQGLLQAFEPML
jgi:hypothetical protein